MRRTKAELQAALDRAAAFNQLFIVRMEVTDPLRLKVLDDPKFIPVERYGLGMLPLYSEFGTDGERRYLLWKPL